MLQPKNSQPQPLAAEPLELNNISVDEVLEKGSLDKVLIPEAQQSENDRR